MTSIILTVVLIPVVVFAADYAIIRLISEADNKRTETD